jgi:hypothetical protein
MPELKALEVGPSGLEIAYERFGVPAAPPVLLIMGAGAQMINWPAGFCLELVDRGMQVIRFDNRDAGRSTLFSDGPVPDFTAAMAGDFSTASYTLSDMAADTVGLLDALGLGSAHLVGASVRHQRQPGHRGCHSRRRAGDLRRHGAQHPTGAVARPGDPYRRSGQSRLGSYVRLNQWIGGTSRTNTKTMAP